MNTLSSNFGVAVLSRLVLGAIGLVSVGLLTRALGPADYGYYSLVFAYLFIFSTLADLGLWTILVREISQPGARESYVVSNIFTLRLAALLILLLAGAVASWWLPYPPVVRWGLLLASVSAIATSLVQLLTGIFQKYLRLYWLSLADVLSRLALLGLLLLAVRRQAGILVFIGAVVIAELLHLALAWRWARRLVRFRLTVDFSYWRQTLRTALPVAVSLVFVLLYFKLDTVLLSLLKPAYDVGVYAAAYKVLEVAIFFPAAYIGLVMPQLSRTAFSAPAEFVRTFRRSFDNLAILGLPVTAYLILFANDIIRLLGGGAFSQSAGVLQILALAVLLIFFGNLGGNALVALDLQKKGMWLYLLGAILNISANLLLIPRYSYYAAAWTTVLTEVVITGGLFWLISRQNGVAIRWTIFKRAFLATLLTGAVVYWADPGFYWATVLALSYFPLLYLLGGLDRADLKTLFTLRQPPPLG